MDSFDGKDIFIEEFSMLSNRWMTMIFKAFAKFNNKVYSFSDCSQCEPLVVKCIIIISYHHYQSNV